MMRITTDHDFTKSQTTKSQTTKSKKSKHTTKTTATDRPLKILHAVGRMNCGGIETWLMHLLRTLDRQKIAMDFLVHTLEPGFYDEELLDSGARIVFAGSQYTPATLTRKFGHTLAQFGPYDVFHSHVGHFSGYLLALSRMHGIKTRIAHSHNDWARAESNASWTRRTYLTAMTTQIRLHATHGIAPSPQAAKTLFGHNWKRDPRFQIIPYGLDFSPFEDHIDRTEIRRQFGFTPENHVFAHVGSFSHQKNHTFLLDLMQRIVQRLPQSRLLLLGDGPLRPAILQKITELNLSPFVTLAGVRSDIPHILQAADAFIFPSHFEGLGLALVEAQAAGLPCVISNTIPADATIIPELINTLDPHTNSPQQWANACINALRRSSPNQETSQETNPKKALQTIKASNFNITTCAQSIQNLYASG